MIKVYRKGNFNFSHERSDLRRLCKLLDESLSEEENVYLLANVELLDVIYKYEVRGEKKERKLYSCSPDLIILKHDAIAVVEMKAYEGKINFPLPVKKVFEGSWTAKVGNYPEVIINEGRDNPYSQVNTNRRAFAAYLTEHEDQFSIDELKGSVWDKAVSFILFTNKNVEFEHSTDERKRRGHWFSSVHLGSLENTDNGEYFPDFIKDITTEERHYKDDKRSKISLSEKCIEKLCQLLECEDVTSDYIGIEEDNVEADHPSISTGFGFAPTLIRGLDGNINEEMQEAYQPSDKILSLPKELRLLAYYVWCLQEESKYSMNLILNSSRADEKRFLLQGLNETIFSENTPMVIPDDQIHLIHAKLRQDNPGLSYGFCIWFKEVQIGNNTFWSGEPLFSTRVKYEQGAYKIAYNNELVINQDVLRRLPPYNTYGDELHAEIDRLYQEDSTPIVIIAKIFRELSFLNDQDVGDLDAIIQGTGTRTQIDMGNLMSLQPINLDNLESGLKPTTGLIYLSESNYYARLLSELRLIGKDWTDKIKINQKPDDLAFRLLSGLEFSPDKKWDVTSYNVVSSNYEQSMAIGYAIRDEIPLSVVSGPPGTGKSQLAINLISTMNMLKKDVLFSSKNHKAVDVVIDRYNPLFAVEAAIDRVAGGVNVAIDDDQGDNFNYSPLTPQEKAIISTEVRNNNQKLKSIKDQIEAYRVATKEIEQVINDIRSILEDNPKLELIDWYIDDTEKLKLEYWKNKLDHLQEKQERSKTFLHRLIDSFNEEHLSVLDAFNKNKFIERNRQKIYQELTNSLTEEIIEKIGKEELLKFSTDFLPLLSRLEKLSIQYKKCSDIITSNTEDELLNNWNTAALGNIDNTKKLLNNIYNDSNTQLKNTAVTCLSINRIEDNLEPGGYDIAVLDESSQTDIISALPVLYRAKRAIVIGDEMQLYPIISLDKEKDYNTFLAYGFNEEDYGKYGFCSSSLLSVADKEIRFKNQERVMLLEHFRCHPNIIGFSNHCFYEKKLRIKTKYNDLVGISWVDHNHDCSPKWSNAGEVDIILQIIEDLLQNNTYKADEIGVVTPFRQQANLITNNISQRFGVDIGSYLLADTAHRFQGDEREVMIFSLVVGPSMRETTYGWMQSGTSKNLVNVSLTRARKELIIIGNRSQVDERRGLLRELSNWVKYCDRIHNHNIQN